MTTCPHTEDGCQARRRAGAGACCRACEHPASGLDDGVTVTTRETTA